MPRRGPLADSTPLPETYNGGAPPLHRAPLRGTRRTDVAIVGAGFTGLSAALHLASSGCSVAVLEAREVGWGGSGRAFGQVVPYAKHDEAHVLATFGRAWGERLVAGLAGGPDLVFHLIKRHGIACEPVRAGLIFAAHTRRARTGLERRAEAASRRSAPVTMLYGDALAALTGTSFYEAALVDLRGGCLNPLAFARGLAAAAIEGGAELFEGSPVSHMERASGRWRLRTSMGEVLAENAVIATDAYTGDLWPGLRRSLVPLRGYQLVSRPLPDALRRSVLPGGQALTDTRHLYSGIRVRPNGALHVSVDGPPFSNRGHPRAALATRRVRTLFPHLPPPRWENAVAGWVAMSPDQYPHLHRLAPGLIAAVGLSGRGIAFGTLLGREIALRVAGRPVHDWMMPDTELRPLPSGALARLAAGALIQSYRALDAAALPRPARI